MLAACGVIVLSQKRAVVGRWMRIVMSQKRSLQMDTLSWCHKNVRIIRWMISWRHKNRKNVEFEWVLDDLDIVRVIVGSQKQEFEENQNISDIVTSQ